jgi:hypothetical protein
VQQKHGQQTIERAQLSWLELNGVAARALPVDPKQMRQPVGPAQVFGSHFNSSSIADGMSC